MQASIRPRGPARTPAKERQVGERATIDERLFTAERVTGVVCENCDSKSHFMLPEVLSGVPDLQLPVRIAFDWVRELGPVMAPKGMLLYKSTGCHFLV